MPSGYQVFNPDGEIVIDTTTRTGRVLAMIPVSGVPSVIVTGSYTKPVDIAGSLFGYVSAVLGPNNEFNYVIVATDGNSLTYTARGGSTIVIGVYDA